MIPSGHERERWLGSSQPPSSPPPPEFHRHWDTAIATFLSSLGMMQALRGFENDMLVINEEWERDKVPKAIEELVRKLTVRFSLAFFGFVTHDA